MKAFIILLLLPSLAWGGNMDDNAGKYVFSISKPTSTNSFNFYDGKLILTITSEGTVKCTYDNIDEAGLALVKYIQDMKTGDWIKKLAESGEICKVLGHSWTKVPHPEVCLTNKQLYEMGGIYTGTICPEGEYQFRLCSICNSKEKIEWKTVK